MLETEDLLLEIPVEYYNYRRPVTSKYYGYNSTNELTMDRKVSLTYLLAAKEA
jgi:hypothetical protein